MSIRLLKAIAATGSSLSIAVFKTNGQITPSTLRTKDLLAGGKPVTAFASATVSRACTTPPEAVAPRDEVLTMSP